MTVRSFTCARCWKEPSTGNLTGLTTMCGRNWSETSGRMRSRNRSMCCATTVIANSWNGGNGNDRTIAKAYGVRVLHGLVKYTFPSVETLEGETLCLWRQSTRSAEPTDRCITSISSTSAPTRATATVADSILIRVCRVPVLVPIRVCRVRGARPDHSLPGQGGIPSNELPDHPPPQVAAGMTLVLNSGTSWEVALRNPGTGIAATASGAGTAAASEPGLARLAGLSSGQPVPPGPQPTPQR